MKSTKLYDNDWERLMKTKLKLKLKSLADVISKYHKLISYLKLDKELEELEDAEY